MKANYNKVYCAVGKVLCGVAGGIVALVVGGSVGLTIAGVVIGAGIGLALEKMLGKAAFGK